MRTSILLAGLAGAAMIGANLPLHSERPARVVVAPCYKPWLSVADERATCAIEAAMARHAEAKGRPEHRLKTDWRVRK